MKYSLKYFLYALLFIGLTGCGLTQTIKEIDQLKADHRARYAEVGKDTATAKRTDSIPINERPMYGGIDKSKHPAMKAADDKFIASVLIQGVTRAQGSQELVGIGQSLRKEKKPGEAIRRFNQAWLLTPDSSDVFFGFATALADQGKQCEASEMGEKALALVAPKAETYRVTAAATTLCAVQNKRSSAEQKNRAFARTDALYQQAETIEANKSEVYRAWTESLYWQGQYADAWRLIAKARAQGIEADPKTVDLLRAAAPEPTN